MIARVYAHHTLITAVSFKLAVALVQGTMLMTSLPQAQVRTPFGSNPAFEE